MNLRKLISLAMIIFIVIPVAFAIILATSTVNALTSPRLYQEYIPQAISELPKFVDISIDMLEEKKGENSPEIQIWIDAMKKAGIDTTTFFVESGISDWLEQEVKLKVKSFGEMLAGKRPFSSIKIEMSGLKKILQKDYVEKVFTDILLNLPEGSEAEQKKWEDYLSETTKNLPACKPPEKLLPEIIEAFKINIDRHFQQEIDFVHHQPEIHLQNFSRIINATGFILMLIPFFFLVIAAFIAGGSASDFFKWLAFPTLISGIVAYGFGLAIKKILTLSTYSILLKSENIAFAEQVFLQSLEKFFLNTITFLFTHIQKVSVVVIITGIIFWAVAIILKQEKKQI